MSPNITDHLAPGKVARIAGGFYLAFVLASVLAGALGHIGMGGAEQVYQAIVTSVGSFRLALVVALISAFLFLMAAWSLYVLLRPINGQLALLFLLLNAIGVAIQCASMFPLISALLLATSRQVVYEGACSSSVDVGYATAASSSGLTASHSSSWSSAGSSIEGRLAVAASDSALM